MSDEVMNKEYPKASQRYAVCQTQLKAKGKAMSTMLVQSTDEAFILPEERAFRAVSDRDDNKEVQYFDKTIMRVGTYVHPKLQWRFVVTRDRLDRYVAAFRRMRDDGVDVSVVADHSWSARDCLGFLVGMRREGDELIGTHELRGKESIELARKVPRTSVWIDRLAKAGNGTTYGEAIVHNSISQSPIIPGMTDDFIPVAAPVVETKATVPVMVFANDPLDDKEITMNSETLKKLQEMLGVADLKEEGVCDAIGALLTTQKTEKETLDASVADLTTKVTTLETQLEELKASKSHEGDGKKNEELDPDVAEVVASSVETIAASCVEAGTITPHVSKELQKMLMGVAGKRNSFALSMKGAANGRPLALSVFNLLRQNDPVKLAEQTGRQVTSLSRHVPDGTGEDNDDEKAADAAQKEILSGLAANEAEL